MYVSPVGKSAKSVRSIEQRSAVAGRGLGTMPPRLWSATGAITEENIFR
jgi:hypothetical protein